MTRETDGSFTSDHEIAGFLFPLSPWYFGVLNIEKVLADSFCFLVNSSWRITFAHIKMLFIFSGFDIYCWTGIRFSWNYFLIFYHL